MDRPLVAALTRHAEEALESFVRNVGLDVNVRRATYSDVNVRFEVEISTVREDGVVMNKQAEDFLQHCEEFGFAKDDLGREFGCGGSVLRIVGLRPRAKLAVVCEQIRPSREGRIRVEAASVKRHLTAQPTSRTSEAPPRLLKDREGEIGS